MLLSALPAPPPAETGRPLQAPFHDREDFAPENGVKVFMIIEAALPARDAWWLIG
jgi:hypothetical protein